MEKKYEFTGEVQGNLKRIRAIRDFGDVKAGYLGGWIESEKNLSHSGDCWLFGNARVSDDARVFGNARVTDGARVYGKAWVSGKAQVFGNARVSGNARVFGNARVSGKAQVFGNARVSGNARVFGNARVSDKASVFGNARVFGDAQVFGYAWVSDSSLTNGEFSLCRDIIRGTQKAYKKYSNYQDYDVRNIKDPRFLEDKESNDWSTIDTAPKDGTDILTWTYLGGMKNEYMVMYWDDEYGWRGGGLEYLKPTHWMPFKRITSK